MRKFVYITVALICLTSYSQNNPLSKDSDISKFSKKQLKSFRIENDKFTKTTFIHYDEYGGCFGGCPLSLYIAIEDGRASLRLVTKYKGNDWIFLERVRLIIDGEDFVYEIENPKREVVSSGIYEESDKLVDDNIMQIIQSIIKSDTEMDIRFEGKSGNRDKSLKTSQLISVKEIFDLYNKL